jgi:hypothetical protein
MKQQLVNELTSRVLGRLKHPCLGAFAGQPTKGNLATSLVDWAKSSPTTLLAPLVRAAVPGGHEATSPSPSPSESPSASPSVRHCRFCGAKNPLGRRSCQNCGRYLGQKVAKGIGTIEGLTPVPHTGEGGGGFSSEHFRVGDVIRLSDDRPAKLLRVGKDLAHVLLLADRTTIAIPISQIETSAVVPRPGSTIWSV